jgi:hypothetical protein
MSMAVTQTYDWNFRCAVLLTKTAPVLRHSNHRPPQQARHASVPLFVLFGTIGRHSNHRPLHYKASAANLRSFGQEPARSINTSAEASSPSSPSKIRDKLRTTVSASLAAAAT